MTVAASFEAIGTTATVVVTRPDALADAQALLERELDELDRAASRFRTDSELSRANARAGTPVSVSPLLAGAVRAALDAASATGGLVTPTLGGSLRVAGYDRTFQAVRARSGWTFAPAPPAPAAWREVRLDDDRRELTVPHGVELDLGATAKALAADRAAVRIAAATGAGTLVCLGGDLAVAGPVPPGGFPVRIADDHAAPLDGFGPVVALSSGGLATSSVAVRRWSTSRGELHHVFDPRTGAPAATPWRTVSVAATSCLDANVAATAALVLGDDAPVWLVQRGLPARLVAHDGTPAHVCGWPEEARAA